MLGQAALPLPGRPPSLLWGPLDPSTRVPPGSTRPQLGGSLSEFPSKRGSQDVPSWALDKAEMGWRPPSWQGPFRTRLGCWLPGVRTELAWLWNELRFRRLRSVVLNIAAREGSFRLQPPPPSPLCREIDASSIRPAAVPADLPHRTAEQNDGAGPPPGPGALSLTPHLPARRLQLAPEAHGATGATHTCQRPWAMPAGQPRTEL